jgi:hypothetical protein
MPKPTSVSKAYSSAQTHIGRSFEVALDKMGRVPFGQDILDPRTIAARKELYAGMIPTMPFDSGYIKPRTADLGNHPNVPNTGQTPKVAAAGKVVDPTAIETAQSSDWVSVDTASGAGLSDSPLQSGP